MGILVTLAHNRADRYNVVHTASAAVSYSDSLSALVLLR